MSDKSNLSVSEQEAQLRATVKAFEQRKQPLRMLEALGAGALPQGARLVVPGSDEGLVVVFTPEEAGKMVEPLRAIIQARLDGLAD